MVGAASPPEYNESHVLKAISVVTTGSQRTHSRRCRGWRALRRNTKISDLRPRSSHPPKHHAAPSSSSSFAPPQGRQKRYLSLASVSRRTTMHVMLSPLIHSRSFEGHPTRRRPSPLRTRSIAGSTPLGRPQRRHAANASKVQGPSKNNGERSKRREK